MQEQEIKVRALLFKEEGMWVAQCLEIDVVCQAKKLDELHKRFTHSIISHMEISTQKGIDIFRNKAPQRFFDIFERSDNEIENQKLKSSQLHPTMRLVDMDLADCA